MVLRSERKQEQLSGFLSLWFLARIGILWEAGSGCPEKAGIEECVNDWLDCWQGEDLLGKNARSLGGNFSRRGVHSYQGIFSILDLDG